MLKLDWNILFTIINLIVLLFILKKFLFSKVLGIIEERENMIQSRFDEASRKETDAAALKSHYEEKISSAETLAKEILDKSHQEAAVYYDKTVRDADAKAQQILNDAKKEIKEQEEKILQDLKDEITLLAADMTKQILLEDSPFDHFISNENGKKNEK